MAKWKFQWTNVDGTHSELHRCSDCECNAIKGVGGSEILTPFCPYCGAKMQFTELSENDICKYYSLV